MFNTAVLMIVALLAGLFFTAPREPGVAPAPIAFERESIKAASRSGHRPAIIAPKASMVVKEIPTAVTEPIARPIAKPKPKPAPTKAHKPSKARGSKPAKPASGRCRGIGVGYNAGVLCSAIRANFSVKTIGGYRPNAHEHTEGRAIDIMVYSNSAKGDAIKAFVMAHAKQYKVQYVIWQQHYYEPGGFNKAMEDRGGITANHYDHVHVTVH